MNICPQQTDRNCCGTDSYRSYSNTDRDYVPCEF